MDAVVGRQCCPSRSPRSAPCSRWLALDRSCGIIQRWSAQHRIRRGGGCGIGMALFTSIMGNAFAAFPVMTAGISRLVRTSSAAAW